MSGLFGERHRAFPQKNWSVGFRNRERPEDPECTGKDCNDSLYPAPTDRFANKTSHDWTVEISESVLPNPMMFPDLQHV